MRSKAEIVIATQVRKNLLKATKFEILKMVQSGRKQIDVVHRFALLTVLFPSF